MISTAPGRAGTRVAAGVGLLTLGWTLAVSLGQWYGGNSSTFDLGLFAQVAQSYAAGDVPYSRIRGLDVLGEHFSPVLVLLGPLWAVWPDPRVLLVAQAVLLAAAAALLTRYAATRLQGRALVLYVVLLLTGYGLVSALTFDFHEVAFAPLFVVLLGLGLLHRRLAPALVGALGLVLVKEDLGLTVLAAAAVWWVTDPGRRRRPPLLLAAVGTVGLVVAFLTIVGVGSDFGGTYLQRLGAGGPGRGLVDVLLTTPRRLLPAAAFVVATLLVGLRSPVAALAVPTLAWRAVSGTSSYWTIDYHYDLVLWAVAALALADRAPTTLGALPARRRLLAAVLVLTDLALGLSRFAGESTPLAILRPAPAVASLERVMSGVPRGSTVAAQDKLGPYLIPRYSVSALDVASDQPVRYAVFFVSDEGGGVDRSPRCARLALSRTAERSGWQRRVDGPVVLVELPDERVPPMPRC